MNYVLFTYSDSVKSMNFEFNSFIIEKNQKNLISRNPD